MPQHYHAVAIGCGRWQIASVTFRSAGVFSVAPVAVLPVVFCAMVAVGCSSEPAGGANDGPAVFSSLCATCHGPEGHPPAAMVARLNVRDLTAPEFRARVTPALVEQQVRRGSANKLMPAFEGISDAKITAVAAYVASPQFLAHK
jgi:mono/diheme cytochrome c family protein